MADPHRSDLDTFLAKIMELKVLNMSGASAGIFGYTEPGNLILNDLKRSAVQFAKEYIRPKTDEPTLSGLAKQIEAQLQTLSITGDFSEKAANKLISDLHTLLEQHTKP
jgi:hypothetical protein